MKTIKFLQDVLFAHRGVDLVQYTSGQEVTSEDPEFLEVCLREKWAKEVGRLKPASNKAVPAAPETK